VIQEGNDPRSELEEKQERGRKIERKKGTGRRNF